LYKVASTLLVEGVKVPASGVKVASMMMPVKEGNTVRPSPLSPFSLLHWRICTPG
jgi:hypothetical protein